MHNDGQSAVPAGQGVCPTFDCQDRQKVGPERERQFDPGDVNSAEAG
jgi:hypothetical protein